MDYRIRSAMQEDVIDISQVIVAALRQTNAQDYTPEIISEVEKHFSPEAIGQLLVQREVFVATVEGEIVATASLDRDVVRSVFVDPLFQRHGLGKALIAMIQSVALSKEVRLLRVPSSITAEGFYASLGFNKVRDEFHGAERTIIMEKRL
ncbi:GNAT family N-acetyltransferase [Pseudomonas sp. TMB3-21]